MHVRGWARASASAGRVGLSPKAPLNGACDPVLTSAAKMGACAFVDASQVLDYGLVSVTGASWGMM